MIDLKSYLEPVQENSLEQLLPAFHPSYYPVSEKLKKWIARFPHFIDHSVQADLLLLFLGSTKKYLDHRSTSHLLRLILAFNFMQKKLLNKATFLPNQRHLSVRRLLTTLRFPFSSKPVLSCLIGFNILDRYELFDEENLVLTVQKHLPNVRLVKESTYHHTSPHKNLKFFYFEIEKHDGTPFSSEEKKLLKNKLEEKVKNSIQKLAPHVYTGPNEEEVYKNILVLSQEIQHLSDPPQAHITFAEQTSKDIVFRVSLVYIAPHHHFSLKNYFFNTTFVSEQVLPVRQFEGHPIEAHVFQLHLPREASLLRSDGSLNFYMARQKVTSLIKNAIGDFRDYNGGIIIKQQELLERFKERFPEISTDDPEFMEAFFYGITPLEKQAVLPQNTLITLFSCFLESANQPLNSFYSYSIHQEAQHAFLVVKIEGLSFTPNLSTFINEQSFTAQDIAYNIINYAQTLYFNCVFLHSKGTEPFLQTLLESLHKWQEKKERKQVLRIGGEYTIVSLDPRIGGDAIAGDVLRLLFEGLTRFNKSGHVENAVAESIEISSDMREYTFKLRASLWNDGSTVSAYDFEYAWKKVLSPTFKTAFAYFFYPIENAQEAKEGTVSLDKVGIYVVDDRTLKVKLITPTPYFLQLTAHPLYSPIHRIVGEQNPQWPYQSEKNYPCNGPFQLKINQPAQGYQFVKNPLYWEAHEIALDQINLTNMNSTQAFQAFQNNEMDWIGNPFGSWHLHYKPGSDSHVVSFPNCWVCWCVLNTSCPPFNNRKLRYAFAYAIQRAKIVANSFMPLNPAYSPLIPPHKNEIRKTLFPEHDADIAHQFFHEALQEMNLTKEELPPLNLIFLEKGIREYTALCLQQQFSACLGIQCTLKPLSSWNALFNKMTTSDFELGIIHWLPVIDDPINILQSFRSPKQETNFSKWHHPEFEKLIELSEHEANPFQRSSYLLKAEELLCQQMPIIPLFYQPYQALVKKDLQINFRPPSGPNNIARSYYKGEKPCWRI